MCAVVGLKLKKLRPRGGQTDADIGGSVVIGEGVRSSECPSIIASSSPVN